MMDILAILITVLVNGAMVLLLAYTSIYAYKYGWRDLEIGVVVILLYTILFTCIIDYTGLYLISTR